jgi:cellulose synthase/poly-beta-1,6-N-acetylglucosamine synthase-like glycosyltransferase
MATLPERMIGAMKADVKTFEEIEQDANAIGQAVAVIVIAALASLIGNMFRYGLGGGFTSLLSALIGYGVWTVIVVLLGTKVMPEAATKAGFAEGFRVIAFAASPGVFNLLAIIPILGYVIGWVISIWMLIVMVIAVRTVLDYTSTARAVIVCLIGFCIYLFLYLMFLLPMLTARAVVGV